MKSPCVWLILLSCGGCELIGGIVERSQADDAGAAGLGGSAGATVGGSGGLDAGSDTATDGDAQSPVVTSVSVVGSAAAEVSQGASVVLDIAGTGFHSGMQITVDDSLSCLPSAISSGKISCSVVLPHGHPLAPGATARLLDVTVSGAVIGSPAQIVLTPITVATGGSDASGTGTPSQPFRSLSHALLANGSAGSGDVVDVEAGTYTQASGETWPVHLPPGVHVRGNGTVLFSASTAEDRFVDQALGSDDAAAPTILENLGISGFHRSVSVTASGHVLVRNVRAQSCHKGFYFGGTVSAVVEGTPGGICEVSGSDLEGLGTVGSAVVSVKDCSFTGNGLNGIRVTWNSSVTVSGGSIVGNGVVNSSYAGDSSNVYVKESAKLELLGTAAAALPINQASNKGCGVWIQNVTGAVEVELDHVEVTGNACGIYHQGGALSVSHSLLADNASEGLSLYPDSQPSSAKLRNVVVQGNGKAGVWYAGESVSLDLGTSADPGLVSFKDNLVFTSDYANMGQLVNLTSQVVDAVGTSFEWTSGGGVITPTGYQTGPTALVVVGKPHYRIVSSSGAIDFGP